MSSMEGFAGRVIDTRQTSIFVSYAGSGPPLLLLHGFPQTHLMWRKIAAQLASQFTVVCADLRGYGRSGCPQSTPDHLPYSKRAMGDDMVDVMQHLGFEHFSVAGHDRGGRVAYRMALDRPEAITRLAVLDIVPTETAWSRADSRLALSFWPWILLAQPEPLPEKILTAVPEAIIDDALAGWGTAAQTFSPEVRDAYVKAISDYEHAHAICEEYRAAATVDREHDKADRLNGRRIKCPMLVLWSTPGALDEWYVDDGGPLALWREWADDVQGSAIKGGHFFPEAAPVETADALRQFFRAA
jgi:haloacetate dehalogenase